MDDTSRELAARLRESPVDTKAVRDCFDALDHPRRVTAARSLGRALQRRLYEAVDGFMPLRLEDMVPASRPDLSTVRHFGRNTLPVFTLFEKRFCRPEGADPHEPGELYGFNFQSLARITGPGYFVAVEDPTRGEVRVDYNRVPSVQPEGWPVPVPNDRGLSRFVYGFMVDTVRRVSEHVSIGSAARNGRDLGSWFVLCREE